MDGEELTMQLQAGVDDMIGELKQSVRQFPHLLGLIGH